MAQYDLDVYWAILLPVLCLASLWEMRRAGPEERLSVWAFLAFGLGLALRLAVTPMPSDVRLDVALDGASVMPHRVSAIARAVEKGIVLLSDSQLLSPWNGLVLLNVLAGSLTVLVVYRIALRLHRDRAAAWAAALLVACFPAAIRFSASESHCTLAALFLALALDFLSLSIERSAGFPLLMAAGWMGALLDIRPEGPGYALGAAVFMASGWRSLVRIRGSALAAAGILVALPALPRVMINVEFLRGSDWVLRGEPGRVLMNFAAFPFNDFTGSLWAALCLTGLVLHAKREPRAAACRLAGLLACTYPLIVNGTLHLDHAASVRYYLPALTLAAIPAAWGAVAWASRLPKGKPARTMIAVLVLAAAAPMGTWRLMGTRWAAQEELLFLLKTLPSIPHGCVILTQAPILNAGAIEPGPSVSALAGRRHDWRLLGRVTTDADAAPAACIVYYRGGSCALHGRDVGGSSATAMPDDCGAYERLLRLSPIARSMAGGESMVSETYRTNPYPVGFFRIDGLTGDERGLGTPSGAGALTFAQVVETYWKLGEHAALTGLVAREGARGRLSPDLWLRCAESARKAGRRDAARRALKRAQESELDGAVFQRLVDAYASLGEHAALTDLVAREGKHRPLSPDLWLSCAEWARKAGRTDAARRALEQAEAAGLDGPAVSRAAGIYWELGEYARLAAFLARPGGLHPPDAETWVSRAEEARRKGDREAAREALGYAEALPDLPFQLLLRMRTAYRGMGERERARRMLARMVSRWPENEGPWTDLARLAAQAGQDEAVDEALRRTKTEEARGGLIFLETLERRAGRKLASAASWADLAEASLGSGAEAEGKRCLDKAAGLDGPPNDLRRVALMYQGLRDYPAALRLWNRLIAANPPDALWLKDRGVLHGMLGDRERALADLRAALSLDPDCLEAALSLGSLYAAQGEQARALRLYDEALTRSPQKAPSRILQMLRSERDRLKNLAR